VMRPLLMTLGDYRSLSLNGAKRLSYLTQLFPSSFNEKLCEQLLQHLRKLLEVAILAHKGNSLYRPLVLLLEVFSSNLSRSISVVALLSARCQVHS
jgi:transformation/transcription domain-associated protein